MLLGTAFHRPISQTHAGIMAGVDQKYSHVGDEFRNKRGVLMLRYPLSTVQPRTETTTGKESIT